MEAGTIVILLVSTIGIVLVGYVVLTPILRALEHPRLLLPWGRSKRIAELQVAAQSLLQEQLEADDRLVLQRALNTLNMPRVRELSGPWAKSDPIVDAQRDIQLIESKIRRHE